MKLAIAILPIGCIDKTIILHMKNGLVKVFPESACLIIDEPAIVPESAYDRSRKQHRSNHLLGFVRRYAARAKGVNRVLGIVDVDIFVPELNFVFGEASFPGGAALISLWRLKPEFYGAKADAKLYAERSLKEAVHELGHTLGLGHCPRYSCVMYFSNSIFDTDRKQSLFCDECYLKATLAIDRLEKI